MNAVTNIHRLAEGLSCVQGDVNSALDDVKGRAGDFKEVVLLTIVNTCWIHPNRWGTTGNAKQTQTGRHLPKRNFQEKVHS